jgi:hypothetical protein
MDLYRILGVLPDSEDVVIRGAYKALMKKYHPDVFEGDKTEAERKVQEINAAFEILGDRARRAAYDRERVSSGNGFNQPSHTKASARKNNEKARDTAQRSSTAYNAASSSASQTNNSKSTQGYWLAWVFTTGAIVLAGTRGLMEISGNRPSTVATSTSPSAIAEKVNPTQSEQEIQAIVRGPEEGGISSATVSQVQSRFKAVFKNFGMVGVADDIRACYLATSSENVIEKKAAIAACMLYDYSAVLLDRSTREWLVSSGLNDPGPAVPYLSDTALAARFDTYSLIAFGNSKAAVKVYFGDAPEKVLQGVSQ